MAAILKLMGSLELKAIKWPHHAASMVLLVLHTLFVFAVHEAHYEGSWGGFLLFLVDLPASLIFVPLVAKIDWNQWLMFLLFGGAWWYWIGLGCTKVWIAAKRRINKSE